MTLDDAFRQLAQRDGADAVPTPECPDSPEHPAPTDAPPRDERYRTTDTLPSPAADLPEEVVSRGGSGVVETAHDQFAERLSNPEAETRIAPPSLPAAETVPVPQSLKKPKSERHLPTAVRNILDDAVEQDLAVTSRDTVFDPLGLRDTVLNEFKAGFAVGFGDAEASVDDAADNLAALAPSPEPPPADEDTSALPSDIFKLLNGSEPPPAPMPAASMPDAAKGADPEKDETWLAAVLRKTSRREGAVMEAEVRDVVRPPDDSKRGTGIFGAPSQSGPQNALMEKFLEGVPEVPATPGDATLMPLPEDWINRLLDSDETEPDPAALASAAVGDAGVPSPSAILNDDYLSTEFGGAPPRPFAQLNTREIDAFLDGSEPPEPATAESQEPGDDLRGTGYWPGEGSKARSGAGLVSESGVTASTSIPTIRLGAPNDIDANNDDEGFHGNPTRDMPMPHTNRAVEPGGIPLAPPEPDVDDAPEEEVHPLAAATRVRTPPPSAPVPEVDGEEDDENNTVTRENPASEDDDSDEEPEQDSDPRTEVLTPPTPYKAEVTSPATGRSRPGYDSSFVMPPPDALLREISRKADGRGLRISDFSADTAWRGTETDQGDDPEVVAGGTSSGGAERVPETEPIKPPTRAVGVRFGKVRQFDRFGYCPLPESGVLADAFLRMRGRVLASLRRPSSMLLAGVSRRSGRTETALHLALRLARRPGARVCLADFDFRRPALASRLGVSMRSFGVADLLRAACPMEDALVYSREDNLYVLPARPPDGDGDDLLDQDNALKLLERLHSAFEFVVLDGGIVGMDAGPVLLAPAVGGVALTVRAGRDRPAQVKRAAALLGDAGGVVSGMVLVGSA